MDDRRGQLLLVAGLGLALAFVVLALVLNAVVFTENLATRNHGETDDVVGHERAVEAGVGGLLAETNAYDDADEPTLQTALNDSVETWDANASLLSAGSGTVTNASVVSTEPGTRVAQPDQRNFSNASGADEWTAATDIEETRRFETVVTPDGTGPVTFVVSDGSASWRVEVSENDSDAGSTDVEVKNGSGDVLADETVETDTALVDVTEGRVANDSVEATAFGAGAAGRPVENWTFAKGVTEPYDVAVENGGSAEGRYGFVVDQPESALPDENYEDRDDGLPTTAPALYSANVSVVVQDDRVTYETNVSVAPADSPGTPPWESPA